MIDPKIPDNAATVEIKKKNTYKPPYITYLSEIFQVNILTSEIFLIDRPFLTLNLMSEKFFSKSYRFRGKKC